MRLTLRTMLAFLDETLEPEDAQVLGKKIEDSEFATNVVHRIRAVTRKMRLPAPALSGKEMGVDPNTVAEYLDNTLSPDRVPDFERLCLESDVHLAEVASCHQVLTLVMRAPAEVPAHLPQRMYSLIEKLPVSQPGPAPAAAPAPKSGETNGDAHARPAARKRPEVPDYLKAPPARERLWRVAAAVVLSLLLLVVILMAATPLGESSLWPWRRAGTSTVAQSGDAAASATGAASEAGGESVAGRDGPTRGSDASSAPGKSADKAGRPRISGGAKAGSTSGLKQPAGAARPDRGPAASGKGSGAGKTAKGDRSKSAKGGKTAADVGTSPAASGASSAGPSAAEGDAAEPDAAGTPAEGDDSSGAESGVEPAGSGVANPGDEDEAASDEAPPVPAAGSVGRVVSTNPLLLKFDQATSQWLRLPAKQPLLVGDRLLSLPAYRPMALLANGVQLELVGDAQLELDPVDKQGTPKLYLPYGRLVLAPVGAVPARVGLHLGDRVGTAVFEDNEAMLAAEVRPQLIEGVDPLENQQLRVELFAARGSITWEEPSEGEPVVLTAPARYVLGPGGGGPGAAEMPVWVTADGVSLSEKQAVPILLKEIPAEGPLYARLLELEGHRRFEVSALAVKWLAAMGQAEPLINALKDESFHKSWSDQVSYLRGIVARGTESAQHIYDTLNRRRGPDGKNLYRLLYGYTEEQLVEEGAAQALVDYLDHDDLDYRVLAFWNLRNLTGVTYSYQPRDPASRRQQSVQKWRQRLASGEILPKKPAPASRTGGNRPGGAPAASTTPN